MADDKKAQPRPAAPDFDPRLAAPSPSFSHERSVSEAKTADAEPAKPNLTMDGIEAHLYGLLVNQGKTPEEAKKLAKEQAAKMRKG